MPVSVCSDQGKDEAESGRAIEKFGKTILALKTQKGSDGLERS